MLIKHGIPRDKMVDTKIYNIILYTFEYNIQKKARMKEKRTEDVHSPNNYDSFTSFWVFSNDLKTKTTT